MSLIPEFCSRIKNAHLGQNGKACLELMSLDPSNPILLQLQQELYKVDPEQVQAVVASILDDVSLSLAEWVMNYFELVLNLQNKDLQAYFDIFANFYSSLVPLFSSHDTFYLLLTVNSLSSYLVDIAFEVDSYGLKGKVRKANSAARLLSKVFNTMLADRSPIEQSKKQGIFHITNLAFKVYFKLNTTRMCQTFINNIQTGGLELEHYPISEQVTFRYYLGRIALYNVKLHQAEEELMFAFKRCHQAHWHNKQLILHHLIPTCVLMGYFPAQDLLEKYGLCGPYGPLLASIRQGDIRRYLDHLDHYFDYFYKHQTYLLLKERGIVLVWRSLIRKICLIKSAHSVVSFQDCFLAFSKGDPQSQFNMSEIECILVSLVSQGYIRGYLHHQKQILVLSRVNAFPPVSQVKLYHEKYNESLMEDHIEKNYPPIPPEIDYLLT